MLRINTEFRRGVLFVRLTGKIEDDSYLNQVNYLIKDVGIRFIVLNINNIEYINLENIKHIIDYNKKVLENKGCLLICDTNQNRNKIFGNNIPNIKCEIDAFSLV